MAELENADLSRKESEAKDKGQWGELVTAKDTRIGKLDAKTKVQAERITELEAQLAQRDILDGIVAASEAPIDRKMLGAAYRDLVGAKQLDRAPKDLETAIKDRHKLLQEGYPSLFATTDGAANKAPANKTGGGGGSPQPKRGKSGARVFNLL